MCGGGPKNVTSTTSNEPPAFLQQPLENVTAAAGTNYTGSLGQNGGSGVGEQIIPNSQQLVNDTIQGNYLSPDTNPYLQSTFNRAADLTQTRLSSEFAGSGRNLGAARPARSEELQTLASNIYGGNYQQERNRQIGAIDQGQALDPLNQYINRLAGIIPGAGGSTQSTQPVFRTGLFG